jgi:hypothetical protein
MPGDESPRGLRETLAAILGAHAPWFPLLIAAFFLTWTFEVATGTNPGLFGLGPRISIVLLLLAAARFLHRAGRVRLQGRPSATEDAAPPQLPR